MGKAEVLKASLFQPFLIRSQISMLRKCSGKRTPAVDEEQVRDHLGVPDPYKYTEPDRLHLRMLRKLPDTF